MDTASKLIKELNEEVSRLRARESDSTELREEVEQLRGRVKEIEKDPIYKIMFNTISDPILILDAKDGWILDANDSALMEYGYSREEITCLNIINLSNEVNQTVLVLKNRITSVPCRIHKRKDGTTFPISVKVSYFNSQEMDKCLVICKFLNDYEDSKTLKDRIERYLKTIKNELNCDWVTLWDFHNGKYDEHGVPIMQITPIAEVTNPGAKHLSFLYQDLPSTLLYENTKYVINQPVIVVNKNSPDSEVLKAEMKKTGIEVSYFSGIADVNNKLIGLVTISFKDDRVLTINQLERFITFSARADYFIVKYQRIIRSVL